VDLALEYVNQGIDLAEKWGRVSTQVEAYNLLALLLHHKGDFTGSQEAANTIDKLVQQMPTKLIEDANSIRQAEIWRDEGNMAVLGNWLRERNIRPGDDDIHFSKIDEYEILVHYLISQGQEEQALTVLTRIIAVAEKAGAKAMVVSNRITEAQVFQALGHNALAINSLRHAVELAENTAFYLVFIAKSKTIIGLLHQLKMKGIAGKFIDEVLSAIEHKSTPVRNKVLTKRNEFIEPLSERERQVLHLLTLELSVPEIAKELFITVSTLRTHIRNIYAKLGVHSRFEAVIKGTELDLI
jgi:LuxR family maltose regulon positive regulatory protein